MQNRWQAVCQSGAGSNHCTPQRRKQAIILLFVDILGILSGQLDDLVWVEIVHSMVTGTPILVVALPPPPGMSAASQCPALELYPVS